MGKDGSGIGAAVVSTPSLLSFSCLDAKTFIVTLVVLSPVLAVWQLQPYESLLFDAGSGGQSNFPVKLDIKNFSGVGTVKSAMDADKDDVAEVLEDEPCSPIEEE